MSSIDFPLGLMWRDLPADLQRGLKMRIVQVGALPVTVLPQHHEVFAREIWGPATGGKKVTVLHNVMLAHGGAEMHTHPDCEHIFYVLVGELKVTDGKQTVIVAAGQGLVIEAGEPHQVTGTGNMDCQYIAITSPPVVWPSKSQPER
jgi:mannose-6-phosphate isomerase-like protein (cupin superfamily)